MADGAEDRGLGRAAAESRPAPPAERRGDRPAAATAEGRAGCAHDRAVAVARARVLRQEQAVAYLAVRGRNTARARRRLAALCHALDALLQRRRGERQGGEEEGEDAAATVSGRRGGAGQDRRAGPSAVAPITMDAQRLAGRREGT